MILFPDIFTPYLTGQELARQANWDDLDKYNKVQAGQIQNALDMELFNPRVNSAYQNLYTQQNNNALFGDTYDNKLAQSDFQTQGMGNALQLDNWNMARRQTLQPGYMDYDAARSAALSRSGPAVVEYNAQSAAREADINRVLLDIEAQIPTLLTTDPQQAQRLMELLRVLRGTRAGQFPTIPAEQIPAGNQGGMGARYGF